MVFAPEVKLFMSEIMFELSTVYVCAADIRALAGMKQHKFVDKCVMIAGTAQFIPNEHIMGLQDFIEQRVIKSISAPVTEKINTGFRFGNSAVLVE